MNRPYAATVVAVVVILLLVCRGPVLRALRSAMRELPARLRFDVHRFLRAAKGRIDDWTAETIADRERKVAFFRRRHLGDGKSNDRRPDGNCIDGSCSRQECAARRSDQSAARATRENG